MVVHHAAAMYVRTYFFSPRDVFAIFTVPSVFQRGTRQVFQSFERCLVPSRSLAPPKLARLGDPHLGRSGLGTRQI